MEISFLLLFNTYYLDRSCPCAPTVFVHIYAFCCWIFESRRRMSFISTPGHAPSHLSSWAGLSAGNFQVATECSSSCPETETEAPGEMDPRIVRQLRGKVMRHVCVLKEVLLLLWHLKEN